MIEHKLRAALELRFGWERWGAKANEYSADYWRRNPFRPLVLALDVPVTALEWYRDQPDPDMAWLKNHRDPHMRDVNCALDPPVTIDWVVAAIDPEQVAVVDRYEPKPPWLRRAASP